MSYRPKPHQSPAWSISGGAFIDIPIELSRWEKFLIAENIEEKDFKRNPKVFEFVKENATKFYVPTNVLKMYGMSVE